MEAESDQKALDSTNVSLKSSVRQKKNLRIITDYGSPLNLEKVIQQDVSETPAMEKSKSTESGLQKLGPTWIGESATKKQNPLKAYLVRNKSGFPFKTSKEVNDEYSSPEGDVEERSRQCFQADTLHVGGVVTAKDMGYETDTPPEFKYLNQASCQKMGACRSPNTPSPTDSGTSEEFPLHNIEDQQCQTGGYSHDTEHGKNLQILPRTVYSVPRKDLPAHSRGMARKSSKSTSENELPVFHSVKFSNSTHRRPARHDRAGSIRKHVATSIESGATYASSSTQASSRPQGSSFCYPHQVFKTPQIPFDEDKNVKAPISFQSEAFLHSKALASPKLKQKTLAKMQDASRENELGNAPGTSLVKEFSTSDQLGSCDSVPSTNTRLSHNIQETTYIHYHIKSVPELEYELCLKSTQEWASLRESDEYQKNQAFHRKPQPATEIESVSDTSFVTEVSTAAQIPSRGCEVCTAGPSSVSHNTDNMAGNIANGEKLSSGDNGRSQNLVEQHSVSEPDLLLSSWVVPTPLGTALESVLSQSPVVDEAPNVVAVPERVFLGDQDHPYPPGALIYTMENRMMISRRLIERTIMAEEAAEHLRNQLNERDLWGPCFCCF